jgi:hypothetical protein
MEVLTRDAGEVSLDAVLDASFPRQLQTAVMGLDGIKLGRDAAEGSLAQALTIGWGGIEKDGVGHFEPGVDEVKDLSVLHTYAANKPMAYKSLAKAAPRQIHIGLDLPSRSEGLTGDYAAQGIGTYVVALAAHVAQVSGAKISIYHNNGENTGAIVTDGDRDQARRGLRVLNGTRDRRIRRPESPNLQGMLKLMHSRIDRNNDVAIIISDFMEGFDAETQSIAWEPGLRTLGRIMKSKNSESRLWTVRIMSPAHEDMPAGLIDMLDMEDAMAIRDEVADDVEIQDRAVSRALARTRSIEISTVRDEQKNHPVRGLTKFVLGKECA